MAVFRHHDRINTALPVDVYHVWRCFHRGKTNIRIHTYGKYTHHPIYRTWNFLCLTLLYASITKHGMNKGKSCFCTHTSIPHLATTQALGMVKPLWGRNCQGKTGHWRETARKALITLHQFYPRIKTNPEDRSFFNALNEVFAHRFHWTQIYWQTGMPIIIMYQ